MTVSEQIDALQAKVADLKSSLDASRHETNEQIKARVATARAKAEAAQQTVHGKADQAAEDDAADALDYAAWAIDQAEAAVLDAADARAWADARAAASPPS